MAESSASFANTRVAHNKSSAVYQGAKVLMRIAYTPLRLLPTNKNKIAFFSRQSDSPTTDIKMLVQEIKTRSPRANIVHVCCRVTPGAKGSLKFSWALLKSMYHMATSKVIVLDSYWPAVSVLPHKKDLRVIQMWHALGKIKKSGLQNLDQVAGRSSSVASVMKMHQGYDFVIAGGKAWNPYYCAGFGVTEDVIRNYGLPRIDYLLQNRVSIANSIYARYPKLKEKPVVLYAPTFRRAETHGFESLLKAIDTSKYNLIVKGHPNQRIDSKQFGISEYTGFRTPDFLTIADYLITDYSAIALEAAALDVKTFYYLFDYKTYLEENGINVSPLSSFPQASFTEANGLLLALREEYPQEAFEAFKQTYLYGDIGKSALHIVDLIFEEAGLERQD